MENKVKEYIRERLNNTLVSRDLHLEHYLAVLDKCDLIFTIGNKGVVRVTNDTGMQYYPAFNFNLKTGEPATEEDWVKYAELVGIE